jgi:hypothetical protein
MPQAVATAIMSYDQAHDFLVRSSLTNQVGGSSCSTALICPDEPEIFVSASLFLIKSARIFAMVERETAA